MNDMKKVETPECDKIQEVREDSQQIGEFLGWLAEQEIELGIWSLDENCLMGIHTTREQLLADFFKIDLVRAEKERRALLDALRETT